MVRFNVSLNRKVTGIVNDKMFHKIYNLGRMSACAGIKDNPDAAFKARVNHHGAPATKVPARRFVYDATRNVGGQNFSAELRKVIFDLLKNPSPETQIFDPEQYYRGSFTGSLEKGKVVHTRARPFGGGDGKQRSPEIIMRRIAAQMAANQRNAIKERAYSGAANNGNDPAHNAPRVAKNKGFDWPMVDAGATYSAITSWVE